jgi:hypothetical protein
MYRSLGLFLSGRHFQARGSWVSRRRAGVTPDVCVCLCAACVAAACPPFRVCRGGGRTSPYLPISTPLGPLAPKAHTASHSTIPTSSPTHLLQDHYPSFILFHPSSLFLLTLARLSWDTKWIEHHLRPTKNPRKKSNPTSSPVKSGKTSARRSPLSRANGRRHTSAV